MTEGAFPAARTARDREAARVLFQVSQNIGGDLDVEAVLRAAMDAVAQAMDADACSILLKAPDADALLFYAVKGEQQSCLEHESIPLNDSTLAGWVAKHGTVLAVPDAYQDSRFNPAYDKRTGFRTRSVLCAPLEIRSKRLGVIQVLNRRDGRPFDEWDCELIKAVASLVAVAIDNAEQHAALVKAERLAAVGQTVAGIAHCVKNILHGLQAGSYLMQENLQREKVGNGIRHGWDVVVRNLQLLSDIVMDMLSYSKPREPFLQPCQVRELCQDIIDLHQNRAAEAGVALSLETDVEPGVVHIDETAMRRCLINLVGNAIDACRGMAGGQVAIQLDESSSPGRFIIRVRDNGCGIPPEIHNRLFEPLFSTKGSKGTGLGLAVARKIVTEHHGTIAVDSAPGAGTTFVLELPVSWGDPGTQRNQ